MRAWQLALLGLVCLCVCPAAADHRNHIYKDGACRSKPCWQLRAVPRVVPLPPPARRLRRKRTHAALLLLLP